MCSGYCEGCSVSCEPEPFVVPVCTCGSDMGYDVRFAEDYSGWVCPICGTLEDDRDFLLPAEAQTWLLENAPDVVAIGDPELMYWAWQDGLADAYTS